MAKDLSTKDRKKLSKKSFALPGKLKYPIPDKARAQRAGPGGAARRPGRAEEGQSRCAETLSEHRQEEVQEIVISPSDHLA